MLETTTGTSRHLSTGEIPCSRQRRQRCRPWNRQRLLVRQHRLGQAELKREGRVEAPWQQQPHREGAPTCASERPQQTDRNRAPGRRQVEGRSGPQAHDVCKERHFEGAARQTRSHVCHGHGSGPRPGLEPCPRQRRRRGVGPEAHDGDTNLGAAPAEVLQLLLSRRTRPFEGPHQRSVAEPRRAGFRCTRGGPARTGCGAGSYPATHGTACPRPGSVTPEAAPALPELLSACRMRGRSRCDRGSAARRCRPTAPSGRTC